MYQGFGLLEATGHLDFYPNGGERQPGCEPSNFMAHVNDLVASNATLTDVVACDHMRVIYLYIDSFLSDIGCQSIGYECSDYDSFNTVIPLKTIAVKYMTFIDITFSLMKKGQVHVLRFGQHKVCSIWLKI